LFETLAAEIRIKNPQNPALASRPSISTPTPIYNQRDSLDSINGILWT